MYQYNSSPSDLSVESLVAYGRAPYQNFHTMLSREEAAEDERMVAWAIETCNLGDVADRPVSALSGGQCQRVWIAMALAQGTSFKKWHENDRFSHLNAFTQGSL